MWPALTKWWQTVASGIKPGPDGRRNWRTLIAHAPLAVSVVLGLAIAAQAADLAAALVGETAMMSGAGITGSEHGRQGRTPPLIALNTISAAHLFGEASGAVSTRSGPAGRAPLMLTGTMATQNPEDGFAIIGSSPTSTRAFHTGSEAAPGVLLVEVYAQRVVLLKGNERVTLVLPHGPLGAQAGVRFAGGRTAAPEESLAGDDDGDTGQTAATLFTPPPMSAANTLVRAFALRPTSIGGERGARIMGTGLNSKALAELGLAPGDVITQINGIPIGSKNAPNLARALQEGGVSLMVDRDGDETSVTIDSSSAANAAQAYGQSDSDN